MNHKVTALGLALAVLPCALSAAKPAASVRTEDDVEALIAQMTLREKIGQLSQLAGENGNGDYAAVIRKGEVGSFINLFNGDGFDPREMHDRLQKTAVEESRLGIPLIFGFDVVHGCTTAFPIPLALACAFEPELFERAQHFAATEARWIGIDWAFAPMCDTARDPRWGRVAETCGEDPYLNALCVAAQVRGFQGRDCSADDRLPGCMKHFAGYSDVAGGRDYNVTEFSEWSLRNLHLPPFRAAVESGVMTAMSGFNTVDGIPACQSRHTLTDVLRGEWGFAGFVVSDWNAVREGITWGRAADVGAAARLALNAGNDMEMVSRCYADGLEREVAEGRVATATVDAAVRNVLRVKLRSGLFAQPFARPIPSAEETNALVSAAHALARECAAKSAVLLKNDGVLPLAVRRVALVGPMGDDLWEPIGCWSSRAVPCRQTLANELRRAMPQGTVVMAARGCAVSCQPETRTREDGSVVVVRQSVAEELDTAAVRRAVADADVVVLAIGETRSWTGENHARCRLSLTGHQQKLFDFVATLGKPIVAVVFSGRPLVLPEVWEKSSAVFYVFQPGCEGPAAIAELLSGNRSPEGRLAISVPLDVAQVPAFYNVCNTGRPGYGQYDDATEHGAKFPFGYGLTYAKFSYAETKVNGKVASCVVTNAGTRPGVETAQLYVRQFACTEGVRPIRELRGFKKVKLAAGESVTVEFALSDERLGYVDRAGRRRCDKPAEYSVRIAADAVSGNETRFWRR